MTDRLLATCLCESTDLRSRRKRMRFLIQVLSPLPDYSFNCFHGGGRKDLHETLMNINIFNPRVDHHCGGAMSDAAQ
jgi:hypothetical protein